MRQLNPAAMRLGNFAGQRQPQARAAALGRLERQQHLCEHGLAHSRTSVAHFGALIGAGADDRELHHRFGTARFMRVLLQIDQ